METLLITGGAGFIGSNFVNYMFQKYPQYHFIVLDALTYAGNPDNFSSLVKNDKRFEFWYGDVKNAEIVNALVERANYVIHFAAETHVARSIFDNKIFYETDVIGTQTICNAILKNYKKIRKFIHISTSEVYGTALQAPMTEQHPLNPCSPYASAKAGADRLVYSYWRTYDIPAIIIRPFNNYGSHQHLEKLIPRFITSSILNAPLTIHGDGQASRDWIHVLDHCRALEAVLQSENTGLFGQAINIATGIDISVNIIAEKILERLNKPKKLIQHTFNRPGQVERHIGSNQLAQTLLHWQPQTNFDTGLEQTINWYVNNQRWWEPLLWMRQIPIKVKEGKIVMH